MSTGLQQKSYEHDSHMGSLSRRVIATIATILLISLETSVIYAADVVVGLRAIVTLRNDQGCLCLPSEVEIGDTLVAYYTYSTNTIDSNPDPAVGSYSYNSTPNQVVVYLEDYVFRTEVTNVNITFNLSNGIDFGGGPEDRYDLSSWNNTTTIPGYPTERIRIHLGDSAAEVLESDSLPLLPPELEDWPFFQAVALIGLGAQWYIFADIVSIQPGIPTSISPIPASKLHLTSFPNPFARVTTISWRASDGNSIVLGVYDARGRLVRNLPLVEHAGEGSANWDGMDSGGKRLPSGVYFIKAKTLTWTETSKVVLLR